MPASTESLDQFYQRQGHAAPQHITAAMGHFNVYNRGDFCNRKMTFSRRDFFKISLLTGTGQLNYATRGVLLDGPALLLSNPMVPYSYEPLSPEQDGYFCLFTDGFFGSERSASLQDSPLFKIGSEPVYFVNEEQYETLAQIFRKMLQEMGSGYIHQQDLMRTYVSLLLHEALKMQPHAAYHQHPNAASRIVNMFQELLERQFPIDAPDHGIKLRTPKDFADHLAVHVNHLNRVIKEVTGKSTIAHIAERIILEAKALLLHTTWGTAEIAYGLGFEYPSYFNTFFKKHTGITPSALRTSLSHEVAPALAS
ncbi:helix-turn-helix domain-containing protein [Hymenobacter bucti]|uniref:Helix-turn-helix domain-containing protein n=1 Tax=Hymenobacter bucti TaxID=1844114 RepID=A0ABW4QNL4_9BACT